MSITFPFLTTYDPAGTSEGTLDPLGLYQIADQLASSLVPAVRERMQRIRFLTTMAVGSLLTEDLPDDLRHPDASPYLVWEWLIVEAVVGAEDQLAGVWGVPGTLMARRARDQRGYLDARSYLKTPRIFGFHGVYKRLALHLGLVDVHLRPGPLAETLIDAWARDRGMAGLNGARATFKLWKSALDDSLSQNPPRTKTRLSQAAWLDLARAFAPSEAGAAERQLLRRLLLVDDQRRLGALPALWQLQTEVNDELPEEAVHRALRMRAPEFAPLLDAIQAYESFARCMQDAFDVLRTEAALPDTHGYRLSDIAGNAFFSAAAGDLHIHYESAQRALGYLPAALRDIFLMRFQAFGEPLDAPALALALCAHHEHVQRAKSIDGKRAWFDRLGPERIYIRQAYRESRGEPQPSRYVHAYRGAPVRRFHIDLS